MQRSLLVPLLALAGSVSACHSTSPPTCNGHAELCERPYDEVAYAGTHGAAANLADGFIPADQSYTLTRQLTDGIRVLHLEIYPWNGAPTLCHAVCALGATPLTDGLNEIAAFSGAHPDDVITLLMESSDLTSDAVWQSVTAAHLDRVAVTQAAGAPWPTLGQLVATGKRVVLLLADQTNTGGTSYPALLPRWTFTMETPWDNETLDDFARCNVDRGAAGAALYVVDTYMEEDPIPSRLDAMTVNSNPFLIDRLLHCSRAAAKSPTFAMVNFYELGDLLLDVDELNGLAAVASGNVDSFPYDSD